MKVEVQKSFEKDISKVKDKKLAAQIFDVIEAFENCETIFEISNIKKMTGSSDFYRIRIGSYRLGFKVTKTTIILLRFMHRKDIYGFFP